MAEKQGEKAGSYHHGDLKTALLEAAETIMSRDGLENLTLRAVAREAGVSHAAPKNHFENLAGLLSALAAKGFQRLGDIMEKSVASETEALERRKAVGRGYIAFARQNPDLFLLIFRREKLDYSCEPLQKAAARAFSMLSTTSNKTGEESGEKIDAEKAGLMAARWALVHGYAMLLIDGQLDAILSRTDISIGEEELSEMIFQLQAPKP